MSIFTTDPIIDIETWNQVLDRGGSEQMPHPGTVTWDSYEIITGTAEFWPVGIAAGGGGSWKSIRYDWADGGFELYTVDPAYRAYLGGDTVQGPSESFSEGFPKTGTKTETDTGAVDAPTQLALGIAAIEAYGVDWSTMDKTTGTSILDAISGRGDPDSGASYCVINYGRFKWKVPHTHTGTYYKIEWDLEFTPAGGGDPELTTGGSWEWTGPGDPGDDSTWLSPWQYIDPPALPGQIRIRNIKAYNLSASPYGIRPSIQYPSP